MENQRICTKCKIIKSFSEFYWDKRFNIPFSRCKKCFAIKCKEYRHSEQGKTIYKNWAAGPGKLSRKNAGIKWRKEHPQQHKATVAAYNAIRDGRLIRQPCKECGNPKSEAHHFSYEKENWLNVIWLCKKHHTEVTFAKFR